MATFRRGAADPLLGFEKSYLQSGIISGPTYAASEISYGEPKPAYLRSSANTNVLTIYCTPVDPLRLVFAIGLESANNGGNEGALRNYIARIQDQETISMTGNNAYVYAYVNENSYPDNPEYWTVEYGIENEKLSTGVDRQFYFQRTQPASPNDGDLWFDLDNNYLKQYSSSGAVWNSVKRVYLGKIGVGNNGYIYTMQSWFPNLGIARYYDSQYTPWYEHPLRHYDGVSFLTNGEFTAISASQWANNTTIAESITGNRIAMEAVSNSLTSMSTISNTNNTMIYFANSITALQVTTNNLTAMNYVANGVTAVNVIANNTTAMPIVTNSSIAMTAVSNSSYFMQNIANNNYVLKLVANSIMVDPDAQVPSQVRMVTGSQANTFLARIPNNTTMLNIFANGTIQNVTSMILSSQTYYNTICTSPANIDAFAGQRVGPIFATGGNQITTITEGNTIYRVHTFNSSGTFRVHSIGDSAANSVEYLVVAGGGGGAGDHHTGGGGAGGLREGKDFPVSLGNYSITVGAGGAGFTRSPTMQPTSPGTFQVTQRMTRGSNSVFSNITAVGGGAGAQEGDPQYYANNDLDNNFAYFEGGSGGGQHYSPGPVFPFQPSGRGIQGHPNLGTQGHHGGWHARNKLPYFADSPVYPVDSFAYGGTGGTAMNHTMGYGHGGGGGGGAGGAGHGGPRDSAHGPKGHNSGASGDGGPGKYSRITGTLTAYAGGGGAAGYWTSSNIPNTPYNSNSPTYPGQTPAAPNNVMTLGIAQQTANGGFGGVGGGGNANHAPGIFDGQPGWPGRVRGGNGTDNRGGGGGAGGGCDAGPAFPSPVYPTRYYSPATYADGGNGGSGIVIIRYPIGRLPDQYTKPLTCNVEYVVVGGGGGGAASHAGGAGAGGFRSSVPTHNSGGGQPAEPIFTAKEGTPYPIIVGAGGQGGSYPGHTSPAERSNRGGDSQFATVMAAGGGRTWDGHNGRSGGSGGGNGNNHNNPGHNSPNPVIASTYPFGHLGSGRGQGYHGQGYQGGVGPDANPPGSPTSPLAPVGVGVGGIHGNGGGGGAGERGKDAGTGPLAMDMGDGGNGMWTTITGSNTYYAGGGGAGYHNGIAPNTMTEFNYGAGGLGGGGDGARAIDSASPLSPSKLAQSGQANRGGGGGGGAHQSMPNWDGMPASGNHGRHGGAGGSGTVILRIPRTFSAVFSPGVTAANSTAVANSFVYTVNATSTTSETVTFVRNTAV